ncbi:BTAD domain-containing putative transcriptional regulator [Microbacterium koreense]|uniref:BTAD domain-containing putative transcriptional regulator n=1 Tax=Microbacterium koreense TaxID=323761 RepID=A0ABW2ZRK3_9MICO
MTTRVFGPLDIDGLTLSPRERTILAALIVTRAAAVTVDELADACWGERPPPTWRQQVHNAIARIRSHVGPECVRTVGTGYALGIDRASIDATQFEDAVTEARAHGLRGAHDRAAAAYRRALALWRGEPFEDVAEWGPARTEAARLAELRASGEEELIEARVRSGEDRTVIADAERLVHEHPLREQRWAVLALANYRADRQADALEVLRSARERLAEDLGVEPGRSLSDLEAAILRQDPALRARPPTVLPDGISACPYRGLEPFDVADSATFFGRDDDIEAVTARCVPGAVVTVVGPSGSGKSSLVRAGVAPRLRARGRAVHVLTPDRSASGISRAFDGASGVVVLDQAEEVRTAPHEAVAEWAQLAARWLAAGGCLVLTVRSDFLDHATALPEIGPEIGRGAYALSPLSPAGIRQAITRPAAAGGLAVEPGLEEVILHDAGDRPGILPALSHALAETWRRREGATLTIAGYEDAGGIAGAIAESAETVYLGLSTAGRDACRALMMRMLERTPEGATVRRRVSVHALADDATRRDVVERLVAARLVTIDTDTAVVSHEAVAQTWPRLSAWLAEDHADAAMLRQISTAADIWHTAGRPSEDLLRGGRLHAAEQWREARAPDLTGVEAAFLVASTRRHRDEAHDLRLRAARERTVNRRLRAALVAAAILIVAVVVASSVAIVRSNDLVALAERERIDALTDTVALLADREPTLAALIAAEAYARWPDDPQTQRSLIETLASTSLERSILFPGALAISGEVIPGSERAFVVVDAVEADEVMTTVRSHVVDLATGDVGAPLAAVLPPLDSRLIRTVDVTPNGETALVVTGALREEDELSSCCMNLLSGVDLTTGELAFDTVALDRRTGGQVAFSPDSRRAYLMHPFALTPLSVDLASGSVTTIDELSPEDHLDQNHLAGGIAAVGDAVYISDVGGVRVFDPDTLRHRHDIALPRGGFSETLLTPVDDDRMLLFGSQGAGLLDLTTEEVVWDVLGDGVSCPFPGAVGAESFFCTTSQTEVREFRLSDGQPTGRIGVGLAPDAMTVDLLADGDHIAIFSGYGAPTIARWRVRGTADYSRMTGDELHAAACAVAGRGLTAHEWSRYLGDAPYVPLCADDR